MQYSGRRHLENLASNSHKSNSYSLLIGDFGVHRNMYRAPKLFYLSPAFLDYSERRKSTNVFTIGSELHDADMDDVVEALIESFHLHQAFSALESECIN